MFNLSFVAEEFRSVIENDVPSHQRTFVMAALENSIDINVDELGTTLTGERNVAGFILRTGTGRPNPSSMWSAIKAEVYDYLCTASKKYANERKDGGSNIKNMVLIISSSLAEHFHVGVGVIVGAVVIATMSALKVGVNAWCALNVPKSH